MNHVDIILGVIESMRLDPERRFSKFVKKATALLQMVIDEKKAIEKARNAGRQKTRANYDCSDPEDFFRIGVLIPLLDDFTIQLKDRFSAHKTIIKSLWRLLPKKAEKSEKASDNEDADELVTDIDIDEICKHYGMYIDTPLVIRSEIELWGKKREKVIDCDKPAIEALNECIREIYPNIFKLLNISSLPVTTCTPERSFSTLRRLKTYLRNSTGEERLTGLALLSVHRDINLDVELVLNTFAKQKARRLKLTL